MRRGLKQPLPVYNTREEQLHRQSWFVQRTYDIISPTDRFIPFQIIRPNATSNIISIELWNAKTDLQQSATILSAIDPSDLDAVSYNDGFDRLIYKGNLALSESLLKGEYYLKINTNDNEYWTEVFSAKGALKDLEDCYHKVTYSSCIVTNNIAYVEEFENYFFIDADSAPEDYEIDAEKKKNGLRVERIISQRYNEFFGFQLLVPSFMSRVLNSLDLNDNKVLRLKTGEEFIIPEFLVEENEIDQVSGDNKIVVKFIIDSSYRSQSCKSPIEYNPTDVDVKMVVTDIISGQGEFLLGGYYCNGEFKAFEIDDVVMIFDDETQQTGAAYVVVDTLNFGWDMFSLHNKWGSPSFYKNVCEDLYWLNSGTDNYRWHDRPIITSRMQLPNGKMRIFGLAFPSTGVSTFFNTTPITDYNQLESGIGFAESDDFNANGVDAEGTFLQETLFYIKSENINYDFGYSDPS